MATSGVNSKVLTLPEEAIADAKRQIAAAKERIEALRKAIKSFEKLRQVPEYAATQN